MKWKCLIAICKINDINGRRSSATCIKYCKDFSVYAVFSIFAWKEFEDTMICLARIQTHAYINGKWKVAHSRKVRRRQIYYSDKHVKVKTTLR